VLHGCVTLDPSTRLWRLMSISSFIWHRPENVAMQPIFLMTGLGVKCNLEEGIPMGMCRTVQSVGHCTAVCNASVRQAAVTGGLST
jgi:hypothetical protein